MHKKKSPKKTILIIIGIVFLILVGRVVVRTANLFPVLFGLVFNRGIDLKQSDDHINILLLGIGGGVHDGPNLTDTIIFASLDPKTNKINLVSIPRDLWVPDLKAKINTAYSTGEGKREGGGLILTKAVVSKVLNQPVDYGLRIDFNGFVKAVDLIGGLDIEVDRTFDDYEYPIEGKENDPCGQKEEDLQKLATASSQLEAFPCRYVHLHFNKGLQHLDGEKALQFVRSRHANGQEGSDFARSRRQEKIIKAFRDKVFSPQTLLNPAKMLDLYDVLKGSIDTDIMQNEFDDFIRLAQKFGGAKIESAVLDSGDAEEDRPGLLVSPQPGIDYGFAWVLIPRKGNGNFSEIQQYIDCELKIGSCQIAKEVTN